MGWFRVVFFGVEAVEDDSMVSVGVYDVGDKFGYCLFYFGNVVLQIGGYIEMLGVLGYIRYWICLVSYFIIDRYILNVLKVVWKKIYIYSYC